jgi:RNA polymerase sigma-70 factor (ECF subfamily)
MFEMCDAEILRMLKDPVTKDNGFLKLMDAYKEPIYWHIRRLVVSHEDAEDILQETFIKVYKHASSFRGESKIFTWLYRIATNECSRYFRDNKERLKNFGSNDWKIDNELAGSDMENSNSILIKFQLAIQQLPEKQRIVFNLRYYDELSYEELSQILGSSVNSLKTNYHLASKKIKQYLIDHAE